MESVTQIQILDKVVCISISTNALGKGMNPSVFQPHPQQWINSKEDWVLLPW